MNEYYTYAYLREDGTPYYIGKGRGKRIYKSHIRQNRTNLKPKDKSKIIFLKQNLTEEEANKHEIYMIAVFGRKDLGTGILRNMTNGGDGISGYTHTEETKKLLSEKNSGKNNAWYGKNHTEETKSKMKESNKSRKRTPHSEETKRKIRESAKKYWKNGGRNVNGKNNSFYNKKHTDECKKLISDLRCKYLYTFISSESKIFETINAKQFCIDYNLSERYVYKVANGKQDNHKGWKITRRPRTEDDK